MRLRAVQIPFRILKGWRISLNSTSKYKGQCSINVAERRATIYAWPSDSPEPPDFMFHELLHVAFRALRTYRDKHQVEEELSQDICKFKL